MPLRETLRLIRETRAGRWALRYLAIFLLLGITGDFIANERPIYCRLEGRVYFPVFQNYMVKLGIGQELGRFVQEGWKNQPYEHVIFPLIPYDAQTIDRRNLGAKSPFGPQRVERPLDWHWLGTDLAGHDVAAGLIHGTRVAMLVGFIGMLTATLLGIWFGGLAGYFGDDGFSSTRSQVFTFLSAVGSSSYFLWAHQYGRIADTSSWVRYGIPLLGVLGLWSLHYYLGKVLAWIPYFRKAILVPFDFWITRLTETLNALPTLLFVMAILATVEHPSIYYIMLVIGGLRWTSISRLVRAELLRIRTLQYVEAAKVLGFGPWHILFRHALPNSLSPVWVALAFGMAGSILVEASLSFLGIGLPVETVTWGSLMRQLSAANLRPWWLAVFPGMAIFFTVLAFNTLGEALQKAFDPKNR